MPSETSEKRASKANQVGAPQNEPEHLPCPRCHSTNTKFCYYNNYNFSQPRHFCKACRRYWTHGGTLRDIPVGGGSRKNAKRSRTTAAPTSASVNDHYRHITTSTAPHHLLPIASDHGSSFPFLTADVKPGLSMSGSFTSLLSTQGPGFLSLSGFGLGVGAGIEDMGFGLGRAVWPFPGIGEGGANGGGGGAGMLGNSWQIESAGDGGFVSGDCFPSLPDLAISTAGRGMK